MHASPTCPSSSAATEPYGQVPTSANNSGGPLQYRRRLDASSYWGGAQDSGAKESRRTLKQPSNNPNQFAAGHSSLVGSPRPLHNPLLQPFSRTKNHTDTSQSQLIPTLIACLYCLLILLRLVGQSSPAVPLQATLFVGLLLYAADLANVPRDLLLYGLLASALGLAVTMVTVAAGTAAGTASLIAIAATTIITMLTVSIWILRHGIEWLASSSSNTTISRQLQAALHSVLPPLCATMTTVSVADLENLQHATLLPVVFAVSLAGTMLWIGAAEIPTLPDTTMEGNGSNGLYARYDNLSIDDSHKNKEQLTAGNYCISPSMAKGHVSLLLLLPLTLQFLLQYGNHGSLVAAYDLLIVGCFSYLLQYVISISDHSKVRPSPYSNIFTTRNRRHFYSVCFGPPLNLKSCILPATVVLVFCFAAQQRYLLAISQSFAHHFLGFKPSVFTTSLYWMLSTVSLLVSAVLQVLTWYTGTSLLSEYQEDVIQLGLALGGASLGKAFGLAWNFTPLPVLGILGLALWLSTRLLRYLVVFLFVAHATGVVVFSYRFAGMEQTTLALPLPGITRISILRFAYCIIWTSSLIGLLSGLSIRSAGGFMGRALKRWDVAGSLMIIYAMALSILEITLLKRAMPSSELVGVDLDVGDMQDSEVLYEHSAAIMSSAVLVGLATMSIGQKVVTEYAGWSTVCLGLGKAIAIYIDTVIVSREAGKSSGNGPAVLVRMLIAALLLFVLALPRMTLEPVFTKAVSRRRSLSSGFPIGEIPRKTKHQLAAYAFCLLPMTLMIAIPYTLLPLVKVLNEQFRDDYLYSSRSALPELLGGTVGLWGLTCLYTLNHCFPEGGGEGWKKMSGLIFLFGMGMVFIAPTFGAGVDSASNPYAAMSGIGSILISRGKYRTGGWGLLSTACATILAITGPLELKERATPGGKDRFLLLRTMLFSLLFGGGVAWFIVLQSMKEVGIVSLVIVLSSSLAIAFMGTIAAVFGYFLSIDEFREARQMMHLWVIVWLVLVFFCGLAELLTSEKMHLFASGGWMLSLLTVSSLTAFSMALSTRARQKRNRSTRASSNSMILLSWSIAMIALYGKCGIAGVGADYEVQTIIGLPFSIVGTFFLSIVLFVLEGEPKSERNHTTSIGTYQLMFIKLCRSNRWAAYFGIVVVLLLASFYSIFLRGAGFFSIDGGVAYTHSELLDGLFRDETADSFRDLATIANERSLLNNAALTSSARLAGSSIWTAKSMFGPLLHAAGLITTMPSLSLLFFEVTRGKTAPSAHISLALPFTLIPVLLCRGIPALRVAGLMALLGGLVQAVQRRKANKESMMRI